MLAGTKQNLWKELITEATSEELFWMNGYLSGLLSASSATAPGTLPLSPAPALPKITIAYGTETGNAKGLATRLSTLAKKKGFLTKLLSLEQYKTEELTKDGVLIIVISTQGDGEPPLAAQKFYDHVHKLDQGLIKALSYAVLALGDSSYPLFCQAGEDIDRQLKKAGANRLISVQKCDIDYEAIATQWFENTLEIIGQDKGRNNPVLTAGKSQQTSHKKQYRGIVSQIINLNDKESQKETYHIEIAAEGLSYQPGDSLGLIPENQDKPVQDILSLLCISAEENILYKNETVNLYHLLKSRLNISYLPERIVKKYAEIIRQNIPATKIGLLDLLKIYPVKDKEQFEEVISILDPITPRLYSISSAPGSHDNEIHITVSRNNYLVNEEKRFGLCSGYLSLFEKGEEISFYIHPNNQFRLPDPDKDIIMIGPGTGIAPFRSFLSEREANGSTGLNWLFFGDQHFVSDFLYQTEIQTWHETGVLQHINVAFSRDQSEKIYVQHKVWEQGARFFNWLENGAYLYICGSKDPMSKDVENMILKTIQFYGNKTEEEADAYLDEMSNTGRYVKDVY